MMAVIFEVKTHSEHTQTYLNAAAALRPLLAQIEGFISIERFQSLTQPGKLLSLSFWRDEQAVQAWRKLEAHRRTQHMGRTVAFADFRLRAASVVRDYGMTERDQAPEDSRAAQG
jgi:heme-degrading monooxygenase HmoA